jgi:UDP-glucose 4-epimerase
MTKSLTFGSNGYLGRHLAYFLREAGFQNQNFDIQPHPVSEVENYQSFDVSNKEDFSKLNPEVNFIFLFAGLSGTADGFNKYEDFVRINEIGLLNLLTWMHETGCKARVVFPSSRLVYKGRKNYALKEDDPKETRTIYAVNKLASENLLWMYQNAFGINYTIFRICVPYGNIFDNLFSYGTMGFFLSKAQKKEDIVLFGDGNLRRTFTHVEDLCNIIIHLVQSEKTRNEIFNIGGENLSLYEAATLVAEKYGVNVNFAGWPEMALKLESDDTVFDDTKLRSLIHSEYKHSLQSWLRGF